MRTHTFVKASPAGDPCRFAHQISILIRDTNRNYVRPELDGLVETEQGQIILESLWIGTWPMSSNVNKQLSLLKNVNNQLSLFKKCQQKAVAFQKCQQTAVTFKNVNNQLLLFKNVNKQMSFFEKCKQTAESRLDMGHVPIFPALNEDLQSSLFLKATGCPYCTTVLIVCSRLLCSRGKSTMG